MYAQLNRTYKYQLDESSFFKVKSLNIPKTCSSRPSSHSFFFSFIIWTPHCSLSLPLLHSLRWSDGSLPAVPGCFELGTPHPALAECRAVEGRTAPPLLRGLHSPGVHSFVCGWKMGLYPAVCLNPPTRGKEKLSVLFSEADVWVRDWNPITEHLRYSAAAGTDCSRWSFMRLKVKHSNDRNSSVSMTLF